MSCCRVGKKCTGFLGLHVLLGTYDMVGEALMPAIMCLWTVPCPTVSIQRCTST